MVSPQVSQAYATFQSALEDLERLVAVRSNLMAAKFATEDVGRAILQRAEILGSVHVHVSEHETLRDLEALVELRRKLNDDNFQHGVQEFMDGCSRPVEFHLHWGGILGGTIYEKINALNTSDLDSPAMDCLTMVERLAHIATKWRGPTTDFNRLIATKLKSLAQSTSMRLNASTQAPSGTSEISVMTPNEDESATELLQNKVALLEDQVARLRENSNLAKSNDETNIRELSELRAKIHQFARTAMSKIADRLAEGACVAEARSREIEILRAEILRLNEAAEAMVIDKCPMELDTSVKFGKLNAEKSRLENKLTRTKEALEGIRVALNCGSLR